MSRAQKHLDSIRKELMERKQELEQELIRLSREKVADTKIQDQGDQAVTSTLEHLNISLQNTEKQEYDRIVQALAKLDSGSYGICVDCKQEISERRLKSYPNSARCLVCQEAFEERGL